MDDRVYPARPARPQHTLAGADERARFENILALLQETDTLAGAVR
jgi:hypothetical protein